MAFLYILAVGGFFFVAWVASKTWHWLRRRNYNVPARDISKGHRWCTTDLFSQPTFCNIEECHIIAGAFCDLCGICVRNRHMKAADKRLKCKALSDLASIHCHQWVRGNLPLLSVCAVCEGACGDLPQLADFKCCWCWRTVHEECRETINESCDCGQYKQFIVPPTSVKLKQVGFKGRRHYVVTSVSDPPVPEWKPLIVLANRKSGSGDGEMILQAFRGLLNPAQVIDLADIPPECGLQWCQLLPHVTFRVLAAGGDGTVGWVLNAIDNLKIKPPPHVSILPLGTGNDLSRVLGWGEGYEGDVDVRPILDQLDQADVVRLDRWRVNVVPNKRFGIRIPAKNIIMNNYFSVGVDALVTMNFHRHRESRPALFGSRIINKFWYFIYGTKDVLERECKHLDRKLKLELDGKEVKLPPIEGIVILNIASWGGGCQPWKMGSNPKEIPDNLYDDGLVEVFALYSSFHIAQLQVGLAEPLRLGQAKVVKLTLTSGKAPMQVDGEPWEQGACEIFVNQHNRVTMLANSS